MKAIIIIIKKWYIQNSIYDNDFCFECGLITYTEWKKENKILYNEINNLNTDK